MKDSEALLPNADHLTILLTMNFFRRRPEPADCGGSTNKPGKKHTANQFGRVRDLNHQDNPPKDIRWTPKRAQANDDGSISLSSWANIDTANAGVAHRLYQSDASIFHEGEKSGQSAKDDASYCVSLSSWAGIDTDDEPITPSRRLATSDSALRYSEDQTRRTKSTPTNYRPPRPLGSSYLPPKPPMFDSHQLKETSWGDAEALSLVNIDIEEEREKAAEALLRRRKAASATSMHSCKGQHSQSRAREHYRPPGAPMSGQWTKLSMPLCHQEHREFGFI